MTLLRKYSLPTILLLLSVALVQGQMRIPSVSTRMD